MLFGTAGWAQQDYGTTPGNDKDEVVKIEKFIVTGSNIPVTETAEEASMFPVLAIDRKTIDQTGLQSLAELLQNLAVSNGGAVPISNNGTGNVPSASSASIHGLGPDATLVLINGHRVANYPLGGGGTIAFVDLNTIPLAAVERVEVLKDGASAIYGADAVAGVVNIILRKNFTGSDIMVRYGNTTGTDSSEFTASILTGASSGANSLTAAFSYEHRNAIFNRDRSYSANTLSLSSFSSPISAQITLAAYDEALGLPAGTLPPGVSRSVFYATPGITPGAPGGNTVAADGNPVANSTNFGNAPASEYIFNNARISRYNYNLAAGSFPDTTRYGVVTSGEHRWQSIPTLTAYFDVSLQRNQELNVLAPFPTGNFTTLGATELVIPANTPNPLPLPDGRARAAPAGAYNPFNPFNLDITGDSRFRLVDFGNRFDRDTNDAAMVTAGLRADKFLGDWNADGGVRYSQIVDRSTDNNISVSRLNRILNQADPIFNPSSPEYIGTTVAYNPFGYYLNPIATNQKVIAYATVKSESRYLSWLGNGFLSANNPSLFALPAGEVGVAAGLDFRRESLAQTPDFYDATGDVVGVSAFSATNSARDVLAVYGEVRVPVLGPAQDVPGVHELTLDGAVRDEDFVTNHHDKVLPKLGLHWSPWSDTFSFRASYGAGIRQPSLYELYVGNSQGYVTYTDPRDGSTVADVPTVIKKNSALTSEKTNSTSAGVVWSPHDALQGFTFVADVWRVERNGTVGVDPQNTIDRFFGAAPGGPQPGEQVLLDQDGTIAGVTALYLNLGQNVAKGLDMSSSYRLQTKGLGRFDFTVMASYLYSIKIAQLPGVPAFEMVDQAVDSSAGDGYLRWKGTVTAGWTGRDFSTVISARYTDGFQDFDPDGNPYRVASTWMYDVQLSYNLGRWLRPWLKDTKLVLGSRNVTNVSPPVAYGSGTNITGYPGTLYDAEGRFWYVSLDKKF